MLHVLLFKSRQGSDSDSFSDVLICKSGIMASTVCSIALNGQLFERYSLGVEVEKSCSRYFGAA